MKLRKSVLAFALAGLVSGAAQALPYVGDFVTSNGANANDGVLLNISGVDIHSTGSAAFFKNNVQLSPTGGSVVAGDIITTYYQGIVSAFTPTASTPNMLQPGNPTVTPNSYQYTVTAMFQELVLSTGTGSALLQPLAGGRISMFYDDGTVAGSFANIALGTGFTDGIEMLKGTVGNPLPNLFVTNGTNAGGNAALDGPIGYAQQGFVDPANLANVTGFLPVPGGFESMTTLQYGPNIAGYQTANFFDNANGWTSQAVNSVLTIKADASVDLIRVPEPASVALLGLGLVGLAFNRRRRATEVA